MSVVKSFGVFEAIAECSIDKDMEKPCHTDKELPLLTMENVKSDEDRWSDETVSDIIGDSADSTILQIPEC